MSRRALVFFLALATVVLGLYARGVWRWAFLCDDAYISFRYAAQLVAGNGLVWNPGEHVEGYTNFLWVLLVAAGLAVDVPAEVSSQSLGVVGGLSVLGGLVWLSRWQHDGVRPLALAAPLALVVTRTFAAWTTSGLETMGFTALAFLGLVAAWREGERADDTPWASSLLLAAATLTRPDGALFAALAGAFHGADAMRGRRSWASLGRWLVPLALIVGGHEAFRIAYYGDVVPNTFRVKVNGVWFDQGLAWLGLFHEDYGFGWYGWLLLVPPLLRRARVDVLLASSVGLWLSYLLYVGGDRFEFRMLVPVMPAAWWLMIEAMALLSERVPVARLRPALLWGAVLALTALGCLGGEARTGPMREGVTSLGYMRSFARRRVDQGQFLRRMVDDGLLAPDTRLCVGAAGALPYHADLWALDYFGLTEPHIARQAVDPGARGLIAHEKHATPQYLVERDVHLFDAVGLLVSARRADARKAWRETEDKLRRHKGNGILQRRCHRVGSDWLVFANGLSDAAHTARFGHLPDCTSEMEDVPTTRARP